MKLTAAPITMQKDECTMPRTMSVIISTALLTMDTPNHLRRLIVTKHREGWGQRRVSVELYEAKFTTFDIIKRYRVAGEMATHRNWCSGHRVLSARDDRLLKRPSDAHPLATACQLQAVVGGRAAHVSFSTVKRSLHISGRAVYHRLNAPSLTPAQMATRLHQCTNSELYVSGKE